MTLRTKKCHNIEKEVINQFKFLGFTVNAIEAMSQTPLEVNV